MGIPTIARVLGNRSTSYLVSTIKSLLLNLEPGDTNEVIFVIYLADETKHERGQLLLELGLLENFAKACPPATVQLVLGILINTVEGTMSVPEGRMREIISLVKEWQGKVKSSKIELQSLIGKLQYITKCVQQSRVFLNRLLETLRSMKGKKTIKLSESFQKDVKWELAS